MNVNSPILVGGCGSSGTTLLATILNRHPEIACGYEMSVFNKRIVYEDYDRFSRMLAVWLDRGVPTDGYCLYPAVFPHRSRCDITDVHLRRWAEDAHTLREFVVFLQSHVLRKRGKTRFAEKTPSNVYCFREFADVFPDGRIIHLVRDGRDVVCSLMRRGMSLFRASSRWLYDTASGTACRDLSQYVEIRYEDLVTHPKLVVQRICDHLEICFAAEMLEIGDDSVPRNGLPAWRSSPTEPISSDSVGQYKEVLDASQLSCFDSVRLTDYAVHKLGLASETSTNELLAALNYPVSDHSRCSQRPPALRQAIQDQMRRNIQSLARGWGIRRPLTWTSP